ncbi:MAG: aldehyde dehydrogenase family protein [Planctomycetota bacterium]
MPTIPAWSASPAPRSATSSAPPCPASATSGRSSTSPATTSPTRASARPSPPPSVVPHVPNDATPEDADEALARAAEIFPKWRDTHHRERSNALIRAAAIMRKRRDELSGIEIREAGKTWREADADVCEAIDFLEYYGRVS